MATLRHQCCHAATVEAVLGKHDILLLLKMLQLIAYQLLHASMVDLYVSHTASHQQLVPVKKKPSTQVSLLIRQRLLPIKYVRCEGLD